MFFLLFYGSLVGEITDDVGDKHMVIPTIAAPNIQLPPPPQAADFSGAQSETSLMARLPFRAVPATLSTPEVYNNTKVFPPLRDPSSAKQSEGGEQSSLPAMPGRPSRQQQGSTKGQVASPGSFTIFFMTQVLAQDDEIALSEAFFYTPEDASLEPEVKNELIQVKYYPSLASQPEPAPVGTRAISEESVELQHQEVALDIPDLHALDGEKTAPDVTVLGNIRDLTSSSVVAVGEPAEPIDGGVEKEEQPRFRGSLIRKVGVSAYDATAYRNDLAGEVAATTLDVPVRLTV